MSEKEKQIIRDLAEKLPDMDDLATWDDYIKEIKEQLNIDLRIRWNN